MNVRPGDIAIVVNSDFVENIGLLVEVLYASSPYSGEETYWTVRSLGLPLKFEWYDLGIGDSGELGIDDECDCPDSSLRPIRDPGEDARDETLIWKSVPSSTKEHA